MNQQNLLTVDAATRVCVFCANVGAAAAGRWFIVLPPPCDVGRNTSREHFQTGSCDGFITGLLQGIGCNLQMTVGARKHALLNSYTALSSVISNYMN